ncbi:MAG TPA: diguanylate cyclase [Longimicrobiaceae bacterium]|nr:diguanylate cyclase [Longimicrobiaceae bacterium]
MTPLDVQGLVSYLGSLTQFGGAVLLAAFFLLLRGHARRRAYFRVWSHAWVWLTAALLAVLTLYVRGWANPPSERVVCFFYQFGKLLFLASLLAGTLAFATGIRPSRTLRIAAPLALVYAALTAAATPELNGAVTWQGPVAVAAFTACAVLLLRLPRTRSTLGSRTVGSVFALLAVLWLVYTVGFALVEESGRPSANAPAVLTFVVHHNSYVDLLLQMLLGYGMVVLLMEDAKRETDDAHGQLAMAHDELKRVALHDSLTGALNRRAWSEGSGLELVRGRYGAAVMLDMDNLKEVNDEHGHAAGDDLLRRLADTLRADTRPTDRLYRWGGDEFLLLLPGARAAEVRPRLEDAIARANAAAAGEAFALSLSIGAADYSGGEELDAAIRRADAAMYLEKGRRRLREE